ncbi:hypothetical protein JAAARDRAFT_93237, partial [Jaapia argillacea MUCL 33604]
PTMPEMKTFVKLLLPKGHGYPLWVPETAGAYTQGDPYTDEGYQIGDVGVITDGGWFDVFFNI